MTLTTDTTTITLNLEQLRVVAKSISKTRDAELRKLERLKRGSHVYEEVKRDYDLIDAIDSEVSAAIAELVEGM